MMRKMFFNCEKVELEPYFCPKCPFKTNILVSLRTHLGKSHTVNSNVGEGIVEESENEKCKKHTCDNCSFETYSIFQFIIHHKKCGECETANENQRFHCDSCTKFNSQSHLNQKHFDETEFQWFECEQCLYKTKSKTDLRVHILEHTNDDCIDWFQCDQCIYKTKIESKLTVHKNKKHTTDNNQTKRKFCLKHSNDVNINWFRCDLCIYKTKKESRLTAHIKIKHTSDNFLRFECDYCLFKTSQKKNLKSHINCIHPNKSSDDWLQCDNCDFKTKSRNTLTKHRISKHTEKRFKCDKCEFKTKYVQGLRDHKILRHKICDQCNFETDSEKRLEDHKKNVHSIEDIVSNWFKCDYCLYKTRQKRYLKAHINSIHPNESPADWLQCDSCDFKTKSCDRLNKHHINKHTEKRFKCDKCEFETKYIGSLRSHKLLVHKEHISFASDFEKRLESHTKFPHSSKEIESCDYKTKGSRLSAHANITHPHDTTAELLQCFICEFSTMSRHILYRHFKSAHMNENGFYECSKCSYKTPHKRTLRRHVLIHSSKININCIRRDQCDSTSRLTCGKNNKDSTEIKWNDCNHCPYKAKNMSNLRKHINRKHPNVSTAPWLNCHHCDFRTKSRDTFKNHCKGKHKKESLNCVEFPYETKNDENLIKHEELEIKDEKPF